MGALSGIGHRRALRRWARAAAAAEAAPPAELERLRAEAEALRCRLDTVLQTTERRARPAGLRRPLDADWIWRPGLFDVPLRPAGAVVRARATTLAPGATLHHDAAPGAAGIVARQARNTSRRAVAPYGLALEVFDFGGDYVSLAIDLPAPALAGLGRHHIFRAELRLATEGRAALSARVNLRQGPETERVIREIPAGTDEAILDFDLAETELGAAPVTAAWIDIIAARPALARVAILDVVLSRRPRADL